MHEIVSKTRDYAVNCHSRTNHEYGQGVSYETHLEMTYVNGVQFAHLLKLEEDNTLLHRVLASCWTHDLIEDCRQSYNKVLDNCGFLIAEITYALTNEKGKNRAERGNDKYYAGITKNKFNVFVKLCDRLANVQYSFETGSSQLKMYREEHKEFVKRFEIGGYTEMFKPMFDKLNSLLLEG